MGIAAAQSEVVAAFRGASVAGNPLRATSDPNDIQTPSVWVPVPDVDFQYNKNRADVTWTAYLLAPSTGKQQTTTEHLGAMIDAVTGLFPFSTGELYTLNLPGGVSVQAYKLTWRGHIAIGA